MLDSRSPIFSLFDNDVLRQKEVLDVYATEFAHSTQFPQSELSDRDQLLSTIANIPDVFKVLSFASDWWISWREQHFALRKTAGNLTLYDFVQAKLRSDEPTAVALGLMAVAMALGQVRPGVDDLAFNLPVPANHIMNYVLAAIDHVVCDTEKYVEQKDSILLFMMRAKHHTENNQLRKAWLRIRQAIKCAKRIGFGSGDVEPVDEEAAEQQRFVASIFEIDHLVSMILGFPYAKDPAFTDVRAFGVILDPNVSDESLKMRALRRIIAVTAGHVNDRNAGGLKCNDFVNSTQATLEMVAEAMPPGWWDMLYQPISGHAASRYESIMTQLWFWTVQAYLHLPYLIRPGEDVQTLRYRKLCLNGTRQLLRSFIYMRTEPAINMYMCNCDDFQALLGACILVVGILQDASRIAESHGAPRSPESERDFAGVDADLGLIEELKDIFRYRISEQGGGISKQGLAVLEELTCFLYEDDIAADRNSDQASMSGLNIGVNRQEKTIMLPYFGTIKVELVKKFPKRQPSYNAQPLPTPPRSTTSSTLEFNGSPQREMSNSFVLPQVHYVQSSTNQTVDLQNSRAYTGFVDSEGMYSQEGWQSSMFDDFQVDVNQISPVSIPWHDWQNYTLYEELDQEWNPLQNFL